MNRTRWRFPRTLAVAAVALGIAGGSYGVASAASGSPNSSGTAAATASTAATAARSPWGAQRSDETPLTGDLASKVRALALAKVPGGTIVRVETDVDGHAAYEAHLVDANGTPVTVYVDKSLNVVGVQSGGPGGHSAAPPASGSGA